MEVELWNYLKKCMRALRQRENVILQWDAVLTALTRKLLNILWKNEGKSLFSVEWLSSHAVTYKMADKDLIFYWYQFLNLLGNPTVIENPTSQWHAIQACTRVADLFNDVGGVLKHDILQEEHTTPVRKVSTSSRQ
jgi:hypothetical protein